jgi:hypothetical protein
MSSATATMTPELFETLKDRPTRDQRTYWQHRLVDAVDQLVRKATGPHCLGFMLNAYMDRHQLMLYCVQPECELDAVRDALVPQLAAIDFQFVTIGSKAKWGSDTYGYFPIFGVAPITPVEVAIAYHATETSRLPKIMAEGLKVGNPDLCHTGFPDTLGKIHLCRTLEGEFESAARWIVEVAKKVGNNPRGYSVLEVDVRLVSGARTHQDVHSHSGIIVDRVDRIVPEALRLVDRQLELPTSVCTTGA